MIKILFSDLDGTLLKENEEHTSGISKENRAAIKQLRDHNIQFAIATGRSVNFLENFFGKDFRYDTVAMAGAMVRVQDKIIYQSEFDHDETLALLDLLEKSGYHYESIGVTHDNVYIFQDETKACERRYTQNPNPFKDHKAVHPLSLFQYMSDYHNPILNCLFVHFQDPMYVNNYQQMLSQRFLNQYAFIRNSPKSIIIAKDGANKGSGIFRACQALNIALQDVACVGDSENDIEMFEMIPMSFCMSHAPTYVKSKAKYIVDSVHECIEIILEHNKKEILSSSNDY